MKVLILIFALSISLLAIEKPTAAEIKKVMNYYQHGKGNGTVLVDSKLCSDVHKKGDEKNNPVDSVDSKKIKKGSKIFLWMNYFVPDKDSCNIYFEFKNRNKVRKVDEMKITGATRYRTWKSIPTNRVGDWEIIITQELEDKDLPISKISYSVVE